MRFYQLSPILSLCAVLLAGTPADAAEAAKKVAAAKPKAVAAKPGKATPDEAFKIFCTEWGEKLHEREVFNIKQIKWDTGQNWVQGTYVGYSAPLSCAVEADSGVVPVGKIIYHEFVYEKRGASVPEAEREPGKAVDTTEVTEIFRYQNGKWVY